MSYRLWDPARSRIVHSRDVTFHEEDSGASTLTPQSQEHSPPEHPSTVALGPVPSPPVPMIANAPTPSLGTDSTTDSTDDTVEREIDRLTAGEQGGASTDDISAGPLQSSNVRAVLREIREGHRATQENQDEQESDEETTASDTSSEDDGAHTDQEGIPHQGKNGQGTRGHPDIDHNQEDTIPDAPVVPSQTPMHGRSRSSVDREVDREAPPQTPPVRRSLRLNPPVPVTEIVRVEDVETAWSGITKRKTFYENRPLGRVTRSLPLTHRPHSPVDFKTSWIIRSRHKVCLSKDRLCLTLEKCLLR